MARSVRKVENLMQEHPAIIDIQVDVQETSINFKKLQKTNLNVLERKQKEKEEQVCDPEETQQKVDEIGEAAAALPAKKKLWVVLDCEDLIWEKVATFYNSTKIHSTYRMVQRSALNARF